MSAASTRWSSLTLCLRRRRPVLLVSYRSLACVVISRGHASAQASPSGQKRRQMIGDPPPSREARLKVAKLRKLSLQFLTTPQQDASSVTAQSDDVGQ